MANNKNEIMIVDEKTLRDKIYTIREQQVMFDYDLATIYGYETKRFNQQVKNNITKFPDDFCFQLTQEEVDELSRSKILTSMQTAGTKGGRTSRPYVFTEQGIYMLMTVLKGELATEQSKKLIRLFKSMKDYIVENQPLLSQKTYIALAEKVEGHSKDIKEIKDSMVTKADLSDFMKLFDSAKESEEILILNGQPFKADDAYQKIYKKAKKSIIVIDDYIGVKTLRHLSTAKSAVKITIISDNKARTPLRKVEYNDFVVEYPGRDITFIKSQNRIHDRYIILDYKTKDMKLYHCGASSKDAGNKVTTITQISDVLEYKNMINTLLMNTQLTLK